jgi:hypothetical protein
MYPAQEMYDLVTCTYSIQLPVHIPFSYLYTFHLVTCTHSIFHMKWHPSLAKAGHDESLTCYDTPNKYMVLVHFCFDNSKSPYGTCAHWVIEWRCHKRSSPLLYQKNLLLQVFDRHRQKVRKVQSKQTKKVGNSADTEVGKGKSERKNWSVCLFPVLNVHSLCKIKSSGTVTQFNYYHIPLLFTFFNICQKVALECSWISLPHWP